MTKTIIPLAIIAMLPFTANAANIQGDMYVAPVGYDSNHPAPETNSNPPYGRVNIDTTDQDHIATTAYVKGAYNSAIAAVNKVDSQFNYTQARLVNDDTQRSMESEVLGASGFVDAVLDGEDDVGHWEEALVSAAGVWAGIDHQLDKKRVDIYTTWDTNNTTQVQLSNVRVQSND